MGNQKLLTRPSFFCFIFLLLLQSALAPNKLRMAGSLRNNSFGFFLFHLSNSNPGQLGMKRKHYRCAMSSPLYLDLVEHWLFGNFNLDA